MLGGSRKLLSRAGLKKEARTSSLLILWYYCHKNWKTQCLWKCEVWYLCYNSSIIPEGILRYKEVIVYHFYLLGVIVYPFYYFTAKHGTPINLLQILNEFGLFCFKAFLKNKKCVKQMSWLTCHNRLIQRNNPDLILATHFSLYWTLRLCISHVSDRWHIQWLNWTVPIGRY